MLPLLTFFTIATATAAETDYDSVARLAQETTSRLIEADTTSPPGSESRAVKIAAKRLDEAGIPYEVTDFAPGRQNIVARLKAAGSPAGRPIMMLAHTDVVTAQGQPWTTNPHHLTSQGKYLVGRGVSDDLGMAATELEVFILLKKRNFAQTRRHPGSTGDEESDGSGIRYLIQHKPESVDAAIVFNEGGSPILSDDGKVRYVGYSAAEKTYQDFELITHAPPGHSSVPLKNNSIYRLAHALTRLEASTQPARLIPVTRAYFSGRAAIEHPPLSDAMLALARSPEGKLPEKALKLIEEDPQLAANLRTTCVATTLAGGTRVNALPAQATANVNCRILPDETVEQTQSRRARSRTRKLSSGFPRTPATPPRLPSTGKGRGLSKK